MKAIEGSSNFKSLTSLQQLLTEQGASKLRKITHRRWAPSEAVLKKGGKLGSLTGAGNFLFHLHRAGTITSSFMFFRWILIRRFAVFFKDGGFFAFLARGVNPLDKHFEQPVVAEVVVKYERVSCVQ